MDQLMKAGEFARLCGTTKETLRHYDRMGVLRPAVRADNGYKLYAIVQFTDYSLINALRSAGLSLDEIRQYLDEPDRVRLQGVLRESIEMLAAQQRELARKQRVLENTLACEARLQEWFDDGQVEGRYKWRIRACEEERFVETAAALVGDDADDALDNVADHLGYCRTHGLGETLQESYRIAASAIEAGDYASGFYIDTRVDGPVDTSRLHVKPAGTYLQWLNCIDAGAVREGGEDDRGNGESNPLFDAYDAMRAFAASRGLTLVGDLYDSELSICSGDYTETFYTEISMRIDEGDQRK